MSIKSFFKCNRIEVLRSYTDKCHGSWIYVALKFLNLWPGCGWGAPFTIHGNWTCLSNRWRGNSECDKTYFVINAILLQPLFVFVAIYIKGYAHFNRAEYGYWQSEMPLTPSCIPLFEQHNFPIVKTFEAVSWIHVHLRLIQNEISLELFVCQTQRSKSWLVFMDWKLYTFHLPLFCWISNDWRIYWIREGDFKETVLLLVSVPSRLDYINGVN